MSLNESGWRMAEYNILVKPVAVEEKTKGGLYIPESTQEREGFARQEGILVDASPLAFSFDDWPDDAEKPKVGDRVMFAKYNGERITGKDGAEYLIMKDKSVVAVMEQDG